ncbi:MAG: dihydroorotate dehydrogenase-like protein [Bacteroidales bacterium]|nr:dihydroorotate dehydrogenase-like protein [Bacteroidales bacterium]
MIDLSCTYLGLQLKSPVIAASSGFTDTVQKIVQLEKHGAGAVVLKSIFEEEITHEYDKTLRDEAENTGREEFLDYLDVRIRQENLTKYLKLIQDAKAAVSIPVIASINCQSSFEWTSFAREIEKAGADALELNVFILPSNLNISDGETEKLYFEIVKFVKEKVNIPIVLKISFYFSNLGQVIRDLSFSGIKGLVLFNRFYSPDFDIDSLEVSSANVLSYPGEISMPLRWIGMMSGRVGCDLSASTGVADGKSAIKLLLAGASTVQLASALYRHGIGYMEVVHQELRDWMEQHGFNRIDDFRGKLSQSRYENPSVFERVQFMKYFSDKEAI